MGVSRGRFCAVVALATVCAGRVRANYAAQVHEAVRERASAGEAGHANPIAKFETSVGTFYAEIFLDRVPRTASNFIDLARTGFYNGIHFHRVIPGMS